MIAIDRQNRKPLHRQIYDSLRTMILDRRLPAGQQIPSSRGLAEELGISRDLPVLGAYAQLLAEGYLESRTGAGTSVAMSLAPGKTGGAFVNRRSPRAHLAHRQTSPGAAAGRGLADWARSTWDNRRTIVSHSTPGRG